MCYARGPMRWAFLPACAALAATPWASARATGTPESRLSTCLDADTFWPHAGPGRFLFFPGGSATAAGVMSFGVTATYLTKPIVLAAAGASPVATEFAAVDKVVDTTFLWSLGIAARAHLDL